MAARNAVRSTSILVRATKQLSQIMMNRTAARLAALLTGLALSSGCGSGYIVDVSNGTVSVDAKFWKPMENPEAFADNFEAREKRPSEVYNQVLTVFKSPIRDDQKLGLALSPGTWCEFMSLHPPAVTLRVRVAHTGH